MRSTFRSLGQSRLRALCQAVGFELETAARVFDVLVDPWGDRVVDGDPAWPSDITDDHSPFEFSLGFEGGRADPRFLVESQGDQPTISAMWNAGKATNDRLRSHFGVSLDRFAQVEELFRPSAPDARFAMWHAVWLRRAEPPIFKIYINPAAHGTARAPSLVREALSRLGFTSAWSFIEQQLSHRLGIDRVIYFSLDLDRTAAARVKVYLAHPNAMLADVEPVLAAATDYHAEDAESFCRTLTGNVGPYGARPLQTCFAFTSSDDARPKSVTFYFPVRCYVPDDGVARDRIVAVLGPSDGDIYIRALRALAPRPLSARAGLQTYASFRRQGEHLRTTMYISPELYDSQVCPGL